MDSNDKPKTFVEELDVAGAHLVQTVKDIIAEGNVRQLRIKAADGDTWLETPLTIGVVAGGVLALAAPFLAILGVIAAMFANVRVEVVREEQSPPDLPSRPAPDTDPRDAPPPLV